MGKVEAAGILVFVGVGIAFVNEFRLVLKKEKEIDARMKKRHEEYAKKMASYGDIGRLFYVPEEPKDEQVKA